MSELWLPDAGAPYYRMIRIRNPRVYDLEESIAASKYPMQVEPNPNDTKLTDTAARLASCPMGEGHDNWLCGVRVAFDLSFSAKALIELERYHFFDIVSCNSTMHRITRFEPSKAYCEYVDPRMVAVMKELICAYNDDPTPENYLKVLYSNPAGFIYTMRIGTNYRQLKTVYAQRHAHRLPEWVELCQWIITLPEANRLIVRGS